MLRGSLSFVAFASTALIAGCATLLGLDEDRELGSTAGGGGATSDGGAPVGGDAAGGSGGADLRALVQRDGAIAYYTLDEPGTFEDLLGSGPSIVPLGGVTHAPVCKIGGCASFDGDDDTATAGNVFQFAGTQSLSIEVLVNPGPIPGHYQQLVSKRRVIEGTPDIEDGYSLSIAPTGEVVFARLRSSESRNVSAPITEGRFSHVVATFDEATGTSAIWVDGELGEAKETAGDIVLIDTDEPFRLAGATSINFGGNLDELAIYDVALTSQQIGEHFGALPVR